MMNKPDERQSLPDRARRYVRGIVVAATLTLAALVFLYATFHADSRTAASTQSKPPQSSSESVPAETGSITRVRD